MLGVWENARIPKESENNFPTQNSVWSARKFGIIRKKTKFLKPPTDIYSPNTTSQINYMEGENSELRGERRDDECLGWEKILDFQWKKIFFGEKKVTGGKWVNTKHRLRFLYTRERR